MNLQVEWTRAGIAPDVQRMLRRAAELHAAGRTQAAQAACEQLSLQGVDVGRLVHTMAITCAQARLYSLALFYLDLASLLEPENPCIHNSRGNVLGSQADFAGAERCYAEALRLDPSYAQAWANRGVTLYKAGRMKEALHDLDTAMRLAPNDPELAYGRAMPLLACGDFERGLAAYEMRWHCAGVRHLRRDFAQPAWLGAGDVSGKTLLVHQEQGMGDAIQMCRYVPLLTARGARVVLGTGDGLVPLMRQFGSDVHVLARGEPLPAFDMHCPMMSLPFAFGTRIDTIPQAAGYLRAEPQRVARWHAVLGDTTRPRIGLVWQGNPGHANDAKRSIPIELLLSCLPAGPCYVSLQRDLTDTARAYLVAAGVYDAGPGLADFAETAAACECMDLIISVDTSVAHLAGALGRPTWLLLPDVPDWRWMCDREDSPWYDSMRIWRQASSGLWCEVLQRVGRALHEEHRADTFTASPCLSALEPALTLRRAQRLPEALAAAQEAVRLDPEHVEAIHMLSSLHHDLGQFRQAAEFGARAVALDPDHPAYRFDLGRALSRLLRHREALVQYEVACARMPSYAAAHTNRGNALSALQRMNEAIAAYDAAIALRSDYSLARFNKSLALLLCGRLEEAWSLYELRWHSGDAQRPQQHAGPTYDGSQDLTDKTVLVQAEQGLGDAIQFSRFAPLLVERGAQVVLQVPHAVAALLHDRWRRVSVIADGDMPPAFDYHCALLSLPGAFSTSLRTIPGQIPYLSADATRVAQWRKELGESSATRIGLVWSGNAAHRNDAARSIPLSMLLKAMPPGCRIVSLQKELRPADAAVLSASGIRHFGNQLRDFADTAALCELVDIVVTVDTAVAHLAGALGRPTKLLLPSNPDWRWMLGRADSPWYPTMRLFRQPLEGGWDAALLELRKALQLSLARPQHDQEARDRLLQSRVFRRGG